MRENVELVANAGYHAIDKKRGQTCHSSKRQLVCSEWLVKLQDIHGKKPKGYRTLADFLAADKKSSLVG